MGGWGGGGNDDLHCNVVRLRDRDTEDGGWVDLHCNVPRERQSRERDTERGRETNY